MIIMFKETVPAAKCSGPLVSMLKYANSTKNHEVSGVFAPLGPTNDEGTKNPENGRVSRVFSL